MKRKSKRELERAVEDLDPECTDHVQSFDAREGVTAEFVSYEDNDLSEEKLADGWTTVRTETASGAVLQSVKRESKEDCG